MTSPFRKPKSSHLFSSQRLTALVLWIVLGVLLAQALSWLIAGAGRLWGGGNFETALHYVSTMEVNPNRASLADGRYGISQSDYDIWRQRQGEPQQPIAQIRPDEVKAIYRLVWDKGQCATYHAPLDVACLDSVVSFGVEGGKRFFWDLPKDAKQAAIEVAQRRETYRQQLVAQQPQQSQPGYATPPRLPSGGFLRPYAPYGATPPYAQAPPAQNQSLDRWLQAGINRDRALATYASAYAPFGIDLPKLFGWKSPDADLPLPSAAERSPQAPPADNSATPLPQKASAQPSTAPLTANDVYAKAKQFTIEVWLTNPQDGTMAPASGVILTADGYILTNYHVIKSGGSMSSLPIRLVTGKEYTGDVIDSNRDLDLALIKLEGAKGLPAAILATDSTHAQIGNTVYAIGSPEGEHWKFTTAQVIELQSQCGLRSVQCIRTPSGFLRPGNSGGPLLDQTGSVIGINRAIQESTGEGVSIPIETVKTYVTQAGVPL